jgi:hypothetical protein
MLPLYLLKDSLLVSAKLSNVAILTPDLKMFVNPRAGVNSLVIYLLVVAYYFFTNIPKKAMPINQDSKSVAAELTTIPKLIPDTKSTTAGVEEERDDLESNTVDREEPTFQFSDESNKETLYLRALRWLVKDLSAVTFKSRISSPEEHELEEEPEFHCGHFLGKIIENMDNSDILVLSNTHGIEGFLIWSVQNPYYTEIDFIQVGIESRRQGLARRMIDALCEHLSDVYLLTVVPARTLKAKGIYQQLGWQNNGKTNYFHKIIRPGLESSQKLPTTGLALAVPFDYYEVNRKNHNSPKTQFFKLEMGLDGKLLVPIICAFKGEEGYIGIYHNGILIEAGRPYQLLNGAHSFGDGFLLVEVHFANTEKYENILNSGSTSPNRAPIKAAIAGRTVGFFRERDPEEATVQAARSQPTGL